MVPFSSPHPTVPSHSHWVNSSEHRWVSFGERRSINNAKDTTDRFCLINCFVERYIEAGATKETGQVV